MKRSQLQIEDEERVLRNYLLGELAEEEREQLEEAYFTDADLFRRLLGVEDDLIDDYIRGELTEPESKLFEQRFGNTVKQEKRLKFAGMLQQAGEQLLEVIPKSPVKELPWWSKIAPAGFDLPPVWTPLLVVAASVLIAVTLGVIWWVVKHKNEQKIEVAEQQIEMPLQATPTLQQTPLPQLTPQPTPTEEKIGRERPQKSSTPMPQRTPQPKQQQMVIASVVLQPGLLRDGGKVSHVTISRSTGQVQLRLHLRPELSLLDYSSFNVAVQTADGKEIVRYTGLKPKTVASNTFINVKIPANLLTQNDYVVLLSGQRSDATQQNLNGYTFTVRRAQ